MARAAPRSPQHPALSVLCLSPSTLLGLPQEGKGAVRQELLPILLSGLSFLPSETGLGFSRPSPDPSPVEVVFPPGTHPSLAPPCSEHPGCREAPVRQHLSVPCPGGQSSFCWVSCHGGAKQSVFASSEQRMGHREAQRVGFWRGWACGPQADTGMHVGRHCPPLTGLSSERLCSLHPQGE